jgi:hypothetical protein
LVTSVYITLSQFISGEFMLFVRLNQVRPGYIRIFLVITGNVKVGQYISRYVRLVQDR